MQRGHSSSNIASRTRSAFSPDQICPSGSAKKRSICGSVSSAAPFCFSQMEHIAHCASQRYVTGKPSIFGTSVILKNCVVNRVHPARDFGPIVLHRALSGCIRHFVAVFFVFEKRENFFRKGQRVQARQDAHGVFSVQEVIYLPSAPERTQQNFRSRAE